MNVAYRYPPLSAPSDAAETPRLDRIARIDIVNDMAAAEAAWQRLTAANPLCTPYQQFPWVALWQRHVGTAQDTRPFIVIGYDAAENPLFLLPLTRRKLGPFTVANFFGGKHASLNSGIWRRDLVAAMTADMARDIVRRISGHGIDVLMLCGQPRIWNGLPNPLALLPNQRSWSDNYRLDLGLPGTQIIARQISATMRARLRTKERKLQKLDGYRYVRARTPEEVDRFIDTFLVQKAAHLARQGLQNIFAAPGVEGFMRAACHEGLASGRPVIEIHALEAKDELLAMFAGTQDGYRFSAMFNTYTLTDNARWSPGLILLMHLVRNCADRGIGTFDIGPGDVRYKTFFCKTLEPMFDNFIPMTAKGRLLAAGLRLGYGAKRAIKTTPAIWKTIETARRLFSSR